MKKHIFIPAMDELQKKELETINHSEKYCFHGLSDIPTLVEAEVVEFNKLLEQLRHEIDRTNVPVDAIIAHWDFPTSVLVPILCEELGLPTPSLLSVLKCEHKLWSRLEQERSVPEEVPGFSGFDPFAEDPLKQIEVGFPFWMKPVKTFSSQLGFFVEDKDDFNQGLEQIRENIGRLGDAFDEALEKVSLPADMEGRGGKSCLAEEVMTGIQLAIEGFVFKGHIQMHGSFDMDTGESGTQIDGLVYPSSAPDPVKRRMADAANRVLTQIGFDNGCFNIEFMWDEQRETLRIIEINTRISQSHSELFILVDGHSNHEVAIDIALGHEPHFMQGNGQYRVAGKFIIVHGEDGIVDSIPSASDIKSLQEKFPGLRIKIDVEPGDRLGELLNQDSYSYVLGEFFVGADSYRQLQDRHRQVLDLLPWRILPVEGEATG